MRAHYRKKAPKSKTFFSTKIDICKQKNLPEKKGSDRIVLGYRRHDRSYILDYDLISFLIDSSIYIFTLHCMSRNTKTSPRLRELFGEMNDHEVSKKLIKKLLQYNMQYEEITRVILSHTERTFLDARLITLEEYYRELQSTKKSEVETFLSSIPDYELQSA